MHIDPTDLHPYPARIGTNIGWVRGALAVPGHMNVLELLNSHDGLLRVKDAWLPSRKERLEFFAVRVGSISLVLPGDHTGDMRKAAEQAKLRVTHPLPTRRVLLLLDKVSVTGTVVTPGRGRVSDVFAAGRSFVRVEGASIHVDRGGGQTDLLDTVPELFVNVARVHGIADLDGSMDPISQTVIPASPESLAAIGQRAPRRRTTDPGPAFAAAARTTSSVPRRPTPLPEPTSTDRDTPFRRG